MQLHYHVPRGEGGRGLLYGLIGARVGLVVIDNPGGRPRRPSEGHSPAPLRDIAQLNTYWTPQLNMLCDCYVIMASLLVIFGSGLPVK